MLLDRGRLRTRLAHREWIEQALRVGAIGVLDLSPKIVCGAMDLPDPFHKDPADRLIVATARVYGCSLLTSDRAILEYAHVRTIS